MRITFRIKLFLFCVFIILLTAIPIATITYNDIYNSLKGELLLHSKEQILQIDNSINGMANQLKANTIFLANSNEARKADQSISALFNIPNVENNKKYSKQLPGIEGSIYNELESYGESHPETTYVFVGTKWGGYIQWPDGLGAGNFDPRKRPWYAPAVENPDKVITSDPYVSAIDNSNNIIISFSSAIKNEANEVIGVAGIDVSLNKLSEIVRSIKVGKDGYIFICTKDGTMLAHPNSNLNFKKLSEYDSKLVSSKDGSEFSIKDSDKIINAENDNFETVIDGKEVFVNIYTSPNTGWKMVSVVQKSELTDRAEELQNLVIIITLCVLVLGIILTYFITKVLTKPIKDLAPIMETAGNGDLAVRANINTKDEFGVLGNSFNLMISRLSSNYDELSAVYEELMATEEELRAQYDELQFNEEALRSSEERYRIALESANDSIWQWDMITGNFFVSDKLIDIIGYKPDPEMDAAKMFKEMVHPDDYVQAKEDLYNHINNLTPAFNSEYRIKTKDGSYVWVYSKGKVSRDAEGKAIKLSGSISDISERRKAEDKIKFLAYYDTLTGLSNKVLFMEKLDEQLELIKSSEVEGAVIFVDLDDFKKINDVMGHKFGDELLIALSEQFKKLVEKKDTICRQGGDEFFILNPSIKENEIEAYVNKLLNLFNQGFKVQDKQISITGSIGVALYPKDGTDSDTIMKNADSAMYKAKELGKNRYALYDPEIYLKLQRKTAIERILRNAIENNEFSINYQPQYDAMKNEIFGFEALLRLNSKELGFISPAEFIPIAEESGYITQIGLWVIKESCLQSVKWLRGGYKFKSISINISSVDLQQPDFIEKVTDIIKETGIDTDIVEFEITETVLMQSLDLSINALNHLKSMGIRIALDDFGTGYSSLNYLRKIPINTLKIDKSFIDNIASNEKEESIINNIIQMAHTMDLKVVAEGVEIADQLSILKEKECDYIQGYYFSKPLPAPEVEKLFEQG
ncbi:EAL domain-containing protein [Clostridium saccharoperbutylacetonicum]|uniref:bifunctional diguanylate cyclase/phosphodiesterase n=1 Tax=Clostridium saccharoperbutylacetonicum TaxID=36745 RepID=UPI000983CB57|nr:EAL domain-containing protein [Clostridium saccharoperbutylacetonicum]AQR94919.1 cyclic di-GMP phosphodiesterase Gmr [Clostridium saccharoperbutylacetonicum]NSB30761.1 diguanylate cyclase (GGDEF)-like protein/PAS domain S-box-containing protein [Clostridium saccharoperbutylacetonicum]